MHDYQKNNRRSIQFKSSIKTIKIEIDSIFTRHSFTCIAFHCHCLSLFAWRNVGVNMEATVWIDVYTSPLIICAPHAQNTNDIYHPLDWLRQTTNFTSIDKVQAFCQVVLFAWNEFMFLWHQICFHLTFSKLQDKYIDFDCAYSLIQWNRLVFI